MFHPTLRSIGAVFHSITSFLRETPEKEERIQKTSPMYTPVSHKNEYCIIISRKKWQNNMMAKYIVHNKGKGS